MTRDLNLDMLNAGAILDALPDGAYITDLDRKILFWNQAAERITGWLRTDVAVEIFDAARRELGVEAFARMAAKADLRRGEAALQELEVALLKYSNRIRLPDDLTLLSAYRAE